MIDCQNDLFHKMPLVCVIGSGTENSLVIVNRLKFEILQGLSTLLFRRWSEVPSRGGVCGDSL